MKSFEYIIVILCLCFVTTAFAGQLWVKPNVILPERVTPIPDDLDKAALKAELLAQKTLTLPQIRHILAKHGAKGTVEQAKYVVDRLIQANKIMTYESRYAILYPSNATP